MLAALHQPAHRVVLGVLRRGAPDGPRDHGEPQGQPQSNDHDDE
jgi:hypothetical protein